MWIKFNKKNIEYRIYLVVNYLEIEWKNITEICKRIIVLIKKMPCNYDVYIKN